MLPDLDEECRERLRRLLREQAVVAAGQLVLLGLDEVKARLGDKWPRYAGRVNDQLAKLLTQTLDAREVFLPLNEDHYVIVFHNRDQAAAQIVCEKIVQSVAALFLGTPDLKGLGADSVVMILDPQTMARSLGLDDGTTDLAAPSVKADGLGWQTMERPDSMSGPAIMRNAKPGGLEAGVCFVPVWDVARGTIYTYKPSILSFRGRRRVSGYHALGEAREEREIRLLDFACLEAAREVLAGGGETAIMKLPVSLRTLGSRDAATQYFQTCGQLPAQARRQIIFEVADITPGTPVWRAYELLATLRRFSRGIFLRIDRSWQDFVRLKEWPLRGLVFDVEMDMRPLARIAADLQRAGGEARARGLAFAVSGVYSRELAQAARVAGARLIYGHYLVAAVSKPLPTAALDWLVLGRLMDGELKPLRLDVPQL